jgi:hypothetical protein
MQYRRISTREFSRHGRLWCLQERSLGSLLRLSSRSFAEIGSAGARKVKTKRQCTPGDAKVFANMDE